MKIQKYTNGAWADLDKPVKKFATYTDEATTLPLTIEASATDAIENYQVYGTAEGAGVETENLVTEIIQNATINSAGTLVTSSTYNVSIAPITAGTTYTLSRDYNYTVGTTHYAFFANLPAKGSTSYDGNRNSAEQVNVTFTAPITGYVVLLNKEGKSTVAEGNTAIPYGYKIPLTVESDTYPLYIGDSKLGEDEYLDYGKQKIYKDVSGTLTPTDPPIPFPTLTTYLGENSIDVDTTTVPDKVVLEYKGWKGIGEPQIYDGGEWKDEPSEDINLIYQLDNAYWSDGYVQNDGTIAPNRPDFQYNEHFVVEPSTTYILAYESSTLDCEVSWYTEDKTFIRTDEIMNNRVCLFTSPSNAKYAILSVPTVATYLLFAKKNDANSLPQITDPIDGTNWKQGWIKSDGTINTDGDYAYYDGAIDVSDCSKVFVGHSNLLVTSRYLETYEMDSSDQKTAYKDEEYIDGTYKVVTLNANTTKLRVSTSRCTEAMVIKSGVYYKT